MARRWTAVDRETGEIIDYPSRSAMRQAVHDNPLLLNRERSDIYEHRVAHNLPTVGPLWSSTQWTADTQSMKRERAFDNATAGLRYAFLSAVTSKDAAAATRIREGWERNVKAYAEGRLDANSYQAGMAELSGWLYGSPYAPPVAIWYHEGSDDYDPGDDSQEDWEDAEYDYE